jgi:hypothetical protein
LSLIAIIITFSFTFQSLKVHAFDYITTQNNSNQAFGMLVCKKSPANTQEEYPYYSNALQIGESSSDFYVASIISSEYQILIVPYFSDTINNKCTDSLPIMKTLEIPTTNSNLSINDNFPSNFANIKPKSKIDKSFYGGDGFPTNNNFSIRQVTGSLTGNQVFNNFISDNICLNGILTPYNSSEPYGVTANIGSNTVQVPRPTLPNCGFSNPNAILNLNGLEGQNTNLLSTSAEDVRDDYNINFTPVPPVSPIPSTGSVLQLTGISQIFNQICINGSLVNSTANNSNTFIIPDGDNVIYLPIINTIDCTNYNQSQFTLKADNDSYRYYVNYTEVAKRDFSITSTVFNVTSSGFFLNNVTSDFGLGYQDKVCINDQVVNSDVSYNGNPYFTLPSGVYQIKPYSINCTDNNTNSSFTIADSTSYNFIVSNNFDPYNTPIDNDPIDNAAPRFLNIRDPYICGGNIFGNVVDAGVGLRQVTVRLIDTSGNIQYTFNPTTDQNGNYEIRLDYSVVKSGGYKVEYFAEDNNGNITTPQSYQVNIRTKINCVNLVRSGGVYINFIGVVVFTIIAALTIKVSFTIKE